MNTARSLILLVLLFAGPVFADVYSVGYLSLAAGSPFGGEQTLTINNLTGPTVCQAYGPPYSACSNLNFTNWMLTVNYTSDYYNASGPAAPSPFVYTDAGVPGPYTGLGDITAGSSLSLAFDLCAGAGTCSSPYVPDTQITSVEFSGQISPASFTLCDNSVPLCNGPTATTFFADPNFTMVWNGSSPNGGPYVNDAYTVADYSQVYAQSPDIMVTDQTTVVTPEPNGYILFTTLLLFAPFARRLKSR